MEYTYTLIQMQVMVYEGLAEVFFKLIIVIEDLLFGRRGTFRSRSKRRKSLLGSDEQLGYWPTMRIYIIIENR